MSGAGTWVELSGREPVLAKTLRYFALVALAGFTLTPIYWIAATALKPELMIETWPPS